MLSRESEKGVLNTLRTGEKLSDVLFSWHKFVRIAFSGSGKDT